MHNFVRPHSPRIRFALALLLSGFCAGCAGTHDESARSADAASEIRIATVGPMSGNYAIFGTQMRRGASQAVEDINAAGGVLGKQLSLVVEDDRCDPGEAVGAAQRVAAQGVVFVVGHFCSGSSIPASGVYQRRGILMMSPASSNPTLTSQGNGLVFRTVSRDDAQPEIAAAYIAAELAGRSVAIAHDETGYGTGLATAMQHALWNRGIRTEFNEQITAARSNYSGLIDKVAVELVGALYYGGYHTEAARIARGLRDRGLGTLLITGDALMTDEYWRLAGDAAEGTLMTGMAEPQFRPAARDVVARFAAKGEIPEGYTLYSYAAVQAWAQAAERAGTIEPAKVAAALKSMETNTVLGRHRFDARGDIAEPLVILYRWSDGEYAPYWSPTKPTS